MKTFKVILESDKPKKSNKVFTCKKISFPEACSEAYKEINSLGFNWRIKSISEFKFTDSE